MLTDTPPYRVGPPDPAVRESRTRVRTAIRNSGFAFPFERVTVNLAPRHDVDLGDVRG